MGLNAILAYLNAKVLCQFIVINDNNVFAQSDEYVVDIRIIYTT